MRFNHSLFKVVFIILIFLLGYSPPLSQAAQQPDSPYDVIPSQRVGNMRVSVATGQPLVLYQVNYPVDLDTPEAMARQYLREQASLLHLQDAELNDLKVRAVRESLSGPTARFSQYVAGIPVYKAEIVVHMNNHNLVTYVANDYHPAIALNETSPTLTDSQARQLAHAEIGVQGAIHFDETKLYVYDQQGMTRLAYQVRVVAETPLGDWEALVDAMTGEVFLVQNNAFHVDDDKKPANLVAVVDGTGLVWNPDPLTSATATYGDTGFTDNSDATSGQLDVERVAVPLRDIEFAGGLYTLRGPYAEIIDFENPRKGLFSQASSDFSFNRFDDAFEAVNTYYHIDDSMRYLNLTLGLTILPYQYGGGVQFDPHGLNGDDNSHYISSSGRLAFGEGGVDDAEDSDVIHHELGHGLHDWVTFGGLSQIDGLSEGTGDYWAQSYNRSIDSWTPADPAYNWVFRWDGHNSFWSGRSTDYGAVYPGGLTGSIHTDGQIWATCMMKVWDAIGKTKTDTAFWEGLSMTNGSTNQEDAAIAVYQAAIDMGYSFADRSAMRSVFETCVYNIPAETAPDFTLFAMPDTMTVCAGNSETSTIDVATINGFVNPVSLSSVGEPAGISVDFSPATINPTPGTSTITITDTGAIAGIYTFDVEGTDGTITRSDTIQVSILEIPTGTMTLMAPADEAIGVDFQPPFTWAAMSGLPDYFIEIATDSGFTAIIDSATVTTNSYTPATPLNNLTQYYWRVQAVNSCGSSAVSSTFSFITQNVVCRTYESTNVPRTIPNNGSVISIVNASTAGTIVDVNVRNLQVAHNRIGQVTIDLSSPLGTSVQLRDLACGTDDNLNINYDDAGLPTAPCPPTDGGTYQPAGNLSDFNGEEASGIWALQLVDTANPDDGTLNRWGLEICAVVPTPLIDVNPTVLSSTQAIDTTTTQPLTIGNVGNASLSWSISEETSTACTASANIPWLSLSPASGSTSIGGTTTVNVQFNSTGLGIGTYNAALCVASSDPVQSVVPVPVMLVVTGCSAPAPPTMINVMQSGVNDLTLSWADTGDSSYEVWWSNEPYFVPGDAGSTKNIVSGPFGSTVTWTHPASTGSASTNYYYVVTNGCGDAGSGTIQRSAEFDFDIVPGT